MKWLVILLILLLGCTSVQPVTPKATHMLHCPAITEERKALQNLMKFEESYKITKDYFYDKCKNPIKWYKIYCTRWMNYMVLLKMEHIELKLEYERASRCSIEEFTTLRKSN